MNKKLLLDKYKNLKQYTNRYRLDDGSMVIGTEVDENNYLYYVTKNGSEIAIIRAEGIRPVEDLIRPKRKFITVSVDPNMAKNFPD